MDQKTCFVFDLHGVLLHRSLYAIARRALKYAYRLDVILLFFNPFFLYKAIKILYRSWVPEQVVIELSKDYPILTPFVQVVISMMNEQHEIPESIALLKRLKHNGYSLYLFSNIGERTFSQLQKKFPDLFALFSGIIVVQEKDNWIQKPYPESYEKFLKTFNLQASECVFVDNNRKNIAAAANRGFYSILFQSPDHLKQELIALNAL
jgi:HAD superfamily hydrolase (TIGR01509 family)